MKFGFFTLGCKVNLFETQALTQLAAARGHEIVDRNADAVIINTCTVTSASDHKNIRAFHKLRRDNPHAVIAACGCFAQVDPERVHAVKEIDLVCGTGDRARVIELCEAAAAGRSVTAAAVRSDSYESLPAGVPRGRTRALLKIEDGCDYCCTYCIIPHARGRVRSLPPKHAQQEVQRMQQGGVHEIVLTGIELASYGRDLSPRISLTQLLCRLLTDFPDIRFRLGSLDPRMVDGLFCKAVAGFGNLAEHFHLSLQSGCDSVLARMGRRYSTEEYFQGVQLLRKTFPDCSITTDLIVGFPGETEGEFLQTLTFLEKCAFASVHVFPYSARKGTRAADMPDQLSQREKAARAKRAKAVAAKLREQYLTRFIGRTMQALPEHLTGEQWTAHGRYEFPIYIKGMGASKNNPVGVRITGLYRDGVCGQIISKRL
nr:tRNA (N(6)-L-threonylcarbamoyladenosine(37)-C(2))-methylthiotransferase MtaB [uncultured Agathobaculum sp.]